MAEPRVLTRFVPASFDQIRRVLFIQVWTAGMAAASIILIGAMVASGYVSWFLLAMMLLVPVFMWGLVYLIATVHAHLGITPNRSIDD